MDNIVIGDRFYRFINDKNVELIKLVKQKNENLYMYTKNNVKSRITKQDLIDNYTRLTPDGYLSFSIVELENNYKDVIAIFMRTKDINNKIQTPYAVCRQCAINPFYNIIMKDDHNYQVGISINKDNCPANVDFNAFLACNKLVYNSTISIYIDDTMEDILKLVQRTTLFDNALKTIKKVSDNKRFKGYCNNLKELIMNNDFMFDIDMGFNINEIKTKLNIVNGSVIKDQIPIIENIINKEIFQTYCAKYDNTIDLEEIKRDYILVRDSNTDLYIVGYEAGDSYINPGYDKYIKDRTEYNTLSKFIK